MGLFGNWKKVKETEFFVGNIEDALRRFDPSWTKLSGDHTRRAVKHLMNIQKINATSEITSEGWEYIEGIATQLRGLYSAAGEDDLAQNCQFIIDACERYA